MDFADLELMNVTFPKPALQPIPLCTINLIVEIVDAPDKIEAFMPVLEAMVGDGLITLERAEVLLYRPGRT